MVPTVSLIGEALMHAKTCKARGVLFVPEWESAYYWPLITPNGRTFYSFVKDYLLLDPFYFNDCNTSSVFSGFAKFRALALLVEF